MPTANPRLTITLQPSLAAKLRRLSELTGNSQSALVSELLSGSGAVLERIIQVLEAAQSAKESMRGMVTADIEAAQAEMEKQLGLVLEMGEQVQGSLVEEMEAVRRRAAKRKSGSSKAEPAGRALKGRGKRANPHI
jgi:hypothetical protein